MVGGPQKTRIFGAAQLIGIVGQVVVVQVVADTVPIGIDSFARIARENTRQWK